MVDALKLAYVPARLIDVGTQPKGLDPRLLVTRGSSCILDGRYAALSYCWGMKWELVARTTKANLSSYQTSMPWSELLNTFRHAISITRSLGLRYLWIDSLCIVQDDEDDVKGEIVYMNKVYGESYGMIAASDARDGTDGCMISRRSYTFGFHSLNDAHTGEAALQVREEYRWSEGVLGPLSKRGRALQERHLPRRVLHYTSKRLLWDCRTS